MFLKELRILWVVQISHGVTSRRRAGKYVWRTIYFYRFFNEILGHTQSVWRSKIKQYPNQKYLKSLILNVEEE